LEYRSLDKDGEQYERKFSLFLECYITIARDQIVSQQMISSDWQAVQGMTVDEMVMKGHIYKTEPYQLQKVFHEPQRVPDKIFEYLNHRVKEYKQFLGAQSHIMSQSIFIRPSLPLKNYQIELFINCMDAMKLILKVSNLLNFEA